MKSGTIIFFGPVSQSNLKSVTLPDNWDIVTIAQEVVAPSQTGGVALTTSMFRAFASTLGPDPLGALMKRSRVDPELAIIVSFSAGHGLLEPLLSFHGPLQGCLRNKSASRHRRSKNNRHPAAITPYIGRAGAPAVWGQTIAATASGCFCSPWKFLGHPIFDPP